jgi:hypothetical protein
VAASAHGRSESVDNMVLCGGGGCGNYGGVLAPLLFPSPTDIPSSMVILLSEHGFHHSEQWISLLRLWMGHWISLEAAQPEPCGGGSQGPQQICTSLPLEFWVLQAGSIIACLSLQPGLRGVK